MAKHLEIGGVDRGQEIIKMVNFKNLQVLEYPLNVKKGEKESARERMMNDMKLHSNNQILI